MRTRNLRRHLSAFCGPANCGNQFLLFRDYYIAWSTRRRSNACPLTCWSGVLGSVFYPAKCGPAFCAKIAPPFIFAESTAMSLGRTLSQPWRQLYSELWKTRCRYANCTRIMRVWKFALLGFHTHTHTHYIILIITFTCATIRGRHSC